MQFIKPAYTRKSGSRSKHSRIGTLSYRTCRRLHRKDFGSYPGAVKAALKTPIAEGGPSLGDGGTALFGGGIRSAFPLAIGRFAPCLPSSDAAASCVQEEISPWTPFLSHRDRFLGGRGEKGGFTADHPGYDPKSYLRPT